MYMYIKLSTRPWRLSSFPPGAAVAIGVLLIILAAVLAALFPNLVNLVMDKELAIREGGLSYKWWKQPPVTPRLQIYIYNVTNADEFLNNGEKPDLQELGPYVYLQRWEKTDIKFNDNGTVTYKIKKTFVFAQVSVLFNLTI